MRGGKSYFRGRLTHKTAILDTNESSFYVNLKVDCD